MTDRPRGSLFGTMHDTPRREPAPGRRSLRPLVAWFFVLLFAGLVWPIYPRFATIEPRVLGMPFSLAYVVGGVCLSFIVLLLLYLRERGPGDD